MAPHLAIATIEHIGAIWRVCANGICKEHQQEWQARVFYHQMTAIDAMPPHGMAPNMIDS